jgi:hypothetical protein
MRPSQLARYKDLGLLLVRHRHLAGIGAGPEDVEQTTADAEALAAGLEELQLLVSIQLSDLPQRRRRRGSGSQRGSGR